MNIYAKKENSRNLWNIKGSFGELNEVVIGSENTYSASNDKISVVSEIIKENDDVFVRKSKVTNISNEEITLTTLYLKFTLDGGEYDVYSQYNGCLNESIGAWHPLVTGVSLYSDSVRNTHSSTPFIALWSNQAGRGEAFHIVSYSTWEINLRREFIAGEISNIVLETGPLCEALAIRLKPGEEYILPDIIYYEFFSKTDIDCWKLHGFLNEKYPRKEIPVIYNTWLYRFDKFGFDDVLKQIEKAADIGAEYFVIDAGWFGKGNDWFMSRGDWEENLTFGFCGRMKEISEAVRNCGMKFGLWLEPECAALESDIVNTYPDYYLKGNNSYFLDFANDDAVNYIFNKTSELLDKFNAKFLKLDFNADLRFDKYNEAFSGYFLGQKKFVELLRKKYPDLYIQNCASGGMRMAIRDGMIYDSFWPTDNQSPYHTIRIFKDSILRIAPQWIDKWITILSTNNIVQSFDGEYVSKILATGDATWTDVSSVHSTYLEAFTKGSPIGLSFDLTSLTDEAFADLKKYVTEFKEKRDFWKDTVCHILTDTESMLILEFRSPDFKKAEIVIFLKKIMQNNVTVYPVLKDCLLYSVLGEKITGKEIFENGVNVKLERNNDAKIIVLEATEG